MTRREFIEDVTTWCELIDFCNDEGCEEYVENIYYEDSYDDAIDSQLADMVRDRSWQDVLSWLQDLPSGYDYYIQDDYEWREADDDDFDSIKNDVLEYMDDGDWWDEDEEEEEPVDEYEEPDDTEPVEEEDVSFADLFSTCNSKVQKIKSEAEANAAAEEEAEETAFDELCVSVGISVAAERGN